MIDYVIVPRTSCICAFSSCNNDMGVTTSKYLGRGEILGDTFHKLRHPRVGICEFGRVVKYAGAGN